ncbi:Dyp-type peroxidase [Stackebrandtia albiflava]|uniref:Dyp-type peroxidase n=1 Tax=Stackebrandtia albiflava TaxID=406432 RepID=UPI00131597BC|nr:Dyp-type peroxidase [Stackebrandtia albiflava]
MAAPAAEGAPEKVTPSRQPGVVSVPPVHTVLFAGDVVVGDRAGVAELLAGVHAAGLSSGVEVTVSVGGGLFDDRFGLSDRRPVRLGVMPEFPGDVLDPGMCHGDLLIQVSADDPDRVASVLERVEALPGLSPRWRMAGFRDRPGVAAGGRATAVNRFGFTEGLGNPDVGDAAEMDSLVWVQPGGGEPAWATGGSYLVVRLIRFAMELWDADLVEEQERVFGRDKDTGAPLGTGDPMADPGYGSDPHGERIALDAHIRLADPRTPETAQNRILRRGYTYDNGTDHTGHPDTGMIFIAYQQDLERGFTTIQQRLTGEALGRYVLTFGGGYYYTLPGTHFDDPDDHPGRTLLRE